MSSIAINTIIGAAWKSLKRTHEELIVRRTHGKRMITLEIQFFISILYFYTIPPYLGVLI